MPVLTAETQTFFIAIVCITAFQLMFIVGLAVISLFEEALELPKTLNIPI